MDFSVVVVSMNRGDRFLRNIPSWNSQEFVKEIIVIDYSSTEELYPKTTCIDTKKMTFYRVEGCQFFNMSKSYNLAVSKATLENIIKIDVDYKLINGDFIRNIKTLEKVFYTCSLISKNGFLICRKDYILGCGGYNENYEQWGRDDIDLRERLKKYGCKEVLLENLDVDLYHEPHDDWMRVENFRIKLKNQDNQNIPLHEKRVSYETISQKTSNYFILRQKD